MDDHKKTGAQTLAGGGGIGTAVVIVTARSWDYDFML